MAVQSPNNPTNALATMYQTADNKYACFVKFPSPTPFVKGNTSVLDALVQRPGWISNDGETYKVLTYKKPSGNMRHPHGIFLEELQIAGFIPIHNLTTPEEFLIISLRYEGPPTNDTLSPPACVETEPEEN